MTDMVKNLSLFSGSVNPQLAEEIASELGVALGNIKRETFANGEIYVRYLQSVRGSDVFLIQSVAGEHINDALMELLIMIDAAKRASARSITAVITHYGYSRQERKTRCRPAFRRRHRQRHLHRFACIRHPGLLRRAREPHDGHADLRGLLREEGLRPGGSLHRLA